MLFTETLALFPETRDGTGAFREELQPPQKYWKLQRIPVLAFLGLNSTAQSSYSPLAQTEQTYYTRTTCLAAAVILFFIQVVINYTD